MPRAAAKLSPARESVPEWWNNEFHRRQDLARKNILDWLRKAGRPLAATELRVRMGSTPRREYDSALASLLSRGAVRQFERTEPRCHGGTATRVYTYYKLTERA